MFVCADLQLSETGSNQNVPQQVSDKQLWYIHTMTSSEIKVRAIKPGKDMDES